MSNSSLEEFERGGRGDVRRLQFLGGMERSRSFSKAWGNRSTGTVQTTIRKGRSGPRRSGGADGGVTGPWPISAQEEGQVKSHQVAHSPRASCSGDTVVCLRGEGVEKGEGISFFHNPVRPQKPMMPLQAQLGPRPGTNQDLGGKKKTEKGSSMLSQWKIKYLRIPCLFKQKKRGKTCENSGSWKRRKKKMPGERN